MRLAVDLINNHSNNWFDQETTNVWLELNLTQQSCDDNAIQKAVSDLVSWATFGTHLHLYSTLS